LITTKEPQSKQKINGITQGIRSWYGIGDKIFKREKERSVLKKGSKAS
jgi:hypothetical protein